MENQEKGGNQVSGKKKISNELLKVHGDGSSRSVVEKLLRKLPNESSVNKPKIFKVARSPLLDQLDTFLPQMQTSTQQLLTRPTHELQKLDIEDTTNDTQVVEMNLMLEEMSSDDSESDSEGTMLATLSKHLPTSYSDSDDETAVGPVTMESISIPSQARGGRRKGKSLIEEVTKAVECERSGDEERSDGEVTVASTSSGER